MYYKEEELYNGTERVYLEEYKYSWIGECCRVGLCVNSLTIFCRADNNCTDGHEYLSQTNKASSWLNNLDTLCPKVAWGITAWLLVYTNTDSKKRLIYGNDTKRGVFSRYKAECVKRYEYANKEDYDYYKANEDEVGIKNLDEAFHAEHIKQEREYIRTFTRPECITEEYYQAILQCSNEYIKWVEDEKRNEAQDKAVNKNLNAPKNLDKVFTPRAVKYLERAKENGYINNDGDTYKWNGSNAQLAYFATRVYNPKRTSQVPYKALEAIFNVKRLASAANQLFTGTNQTQRWIEEIDRELFYD